MDLIVNPSSTYAGKYLSIWRCAVCYLIDELNALNAFSGSVCFRSCMKLVVIISLAYGCHCCALTLTSLLYLLDWPACFVVCFRHFAHFDQFGCHLPILKPGNGSTLWSRVMLVREFQRRKLLVLASSKMLIHLSRILTMRLKDRHCMHLLDKLFFFYFLNWVSNRIRRHKRLGNLILILTPSAGLASNLRHIVLAEGWSLERPRWWNIGLKLLSGLCICFRFIFCCMQLSTAS